MLNNKQSDYHLRYTGNYFDNIHGIGYHSQPLTFHEFLEKPEALFVYESEFMQIPGYIQQAQEILPIEEQARQFVTSYLMDEFDALFLGMQDYVRWSKLFEHRCAELAPSFWSQVNMIDLMIAKDLEMDDNTITRTQQGNATNLGGSTAETVAASTTDASGQVKTVQDIDNTQSTDSSTREANASVVRATDQLTDEIDYQWSDAADNVHEIRTRAGDQNQHTESQVDSTNTSSTNSNSTTTNMMNNAQQTNQSTSNDIMSMTNKMFMQERQWAIDTARLLTPLTWLRNALRPMFYLIY